MQGPNEGGDKVVCPAETRTRVDTGAIVSEGAIVDPSGALESAEVDIFEHEQAPSQPAEAPEVNHIFAQNETTLRPRLPEFEPLSAADNFTWGNVEGVTFKSAVNTAFMEIVHWRRNLFMIPSGKAGKEFVQEQARLWRAYATASALEAVALRAASVMSILLLQKPYEQSKSRDHVSCLTRRLKTWLEGDIESLLNEGRTIQSHLHRGKKHRSQEDVTRTFTKLMFLGRVSSAMRVLTSASSGSVLDLDTDVSGKSVRDILKEKHPLGEQAHDEAFLDRLDGPERPHPVLFEKITGASIRSAALRTSGGAGPSGVDAAGWRRMCVSFHGASKALCDALAGVARRIATTYVDPQGLTAFTACRLCPLDKCPGVRPIGISEVSRRIIGKAIMGVVGQDVRNAAGNLQLSAGQPAGCEAAVHAMRELFESTETDGVLLVDARNAFNCLNREAALWNINILCPALGPVVINTYRSSSDMFVGGEIILSTEGTTQGDPLAMAIYSVAITPLIRRVKQEDTKQIWFADDATGGGKLRGLRVWWDNLNKYGPIYGYFVNCSKTWLVVKEEHFAEAQVIFQDTGVNITKEGRRHLGAAIGNDEFVSKYVGDQVKDWQQQIYDLINIAKSQPQCAYAAFRHCLSSRWTFLIRTVPGIDDLLKPLEETIRHKFIPALTGQENPGDTERKLLSLPTRLGGLGITNPAEIAAEQHQASRRISAQQVALIIQQTNSYSPVTEYARAMRNSIRADRRRQQRQVAIQLKQHLPDPLQRCIDLAQEKGSSTWLEALPMKEHGFSLSKTEFQDALCLRYGWTPTRLPNTCVCGAAFDMRHALSCPTGGLPSVRHDEIRDTLANILTEVCPDVATEPMLPSGNDEKRLDIRARGFWGGRLEIAFFDVRVFNPFAASAVSTQLPQLYHRHELEKRRKYEQLLLDDNCSFTPLIFSTSGGASPLTTTFLRVLATKLNGKTTSTYAQTLCWLRTVLNFIIIRTASMCLRASRSTRARPINVKDIEPVAALSSAGLL